MLSLKVITLDKDSLVAKKKDLQHTIYLLGNACVMNNLMLIIPHQHEYSRNYEHYKLI